jgi:hypothetical protein
MTILGCLGLFVGWLPMMLQHPIRQHHGRPTEQINYFRRDCNWQYHSIWDTPVSIPHIIDFMLSSSCSLLRLAEVPTICGGSTDTSYFRLPDCHLTFWQWVYAFGQGLLESTSALVCFCPWQCLGIKCYSCWHWNPWIICPSRLLKQRSQTRVEWSVSGGIVGRGICRSVSVISQ